MRLVVPNFFRFVLFMDFDFRNYDDLETSKIGFHISSENSDILYATQTSRGEKGEKGKRRRWGTDFCVRVEAYLFE